MENERKPIIAKRMGRPTLVENSNRETRSIFSTESSFHGRHLLLCQIKFHVSLGLTVLATSHQLTLVTVFLFLSIMADRAALWTGEIGGKVPSVIFVYNLCSKRLAVDGSSIFGLHLSTLCKSCDER
jgi:hypothetical protein